MSRKVTQIFQERAHIEKTLLKSIGDYRPTGDEDFDSMVRHHLLQDVSERSESFILSLYDIAHSMTFGEWQDFWFDMGIRIFDAEDEWHTDLADLTDFDEDCDADYEIDDNDFAL